jgi:serine protease Do
MKRTLMLFILAAFVVLSCKNSSNIAGNGPMPVIDPHLYVNLAELQEELHAVSKNQTPSVVSISTERTITQSDGFDPFDFFFNNPFGPRNDQPKGNNKQKQREFKQGGLGSGVIYKKTGKNYFIITNNHVIEEVDSIKVIVDQEKSYKAELLGTDPAIDIAVVKVTTSDELVTAKFGDSDTVKQGDFVIAIGNPFGLQGTMTFGIISAIGRGDISTGKVNLTSFFQTDAAINPGNSGGPLINLGGEVVGINTLIYSRSGGNEGIGFTIPSNIVQKTADQIIEKGKVEHGYLGIEFEALNEDKIKTLDFKDIKNGMHVLNIFEGSPAEKAGVKPGDVVLELNGQKLKNSSDLTIAIGNSVPGTKITLKILRDGKIFDKEIVLGNRNDMKTAQSSKSETIDNYGFELANLTDSLRSQYKIPSSIEGVIILKLDPNGPAGQSGLEEGDIVFKINSKKVKTVEEIKNILKDNQEENYFYIYRSGKEFIIKM